MNKTIAVENFLTCLQSHPSFPDSNKVLLLAFSSAYSEFVNLLRDTIKKKNLPLAVRTFSLDSCNSDEFKKQIESSSLYVLFYDSDYSLPQMKPTYILNIEPLLKQSWKRSCVIKNYGSHIYEAFAISPFEIKKINGQVLDCASRAKKMIYRSASGSNLEIEIENAKWTSIDGFGNPDLIPGEIATIGKVNGTVFFSGTFLSTLPFVYNYGMVSNSPLRLEIRDNEIINFSGISKEFEEEFSIYLKFRASNRRVEEVGVGTNPSVQLHAVNAGFEERHVGLHLGIGGAEAGSNHVDLIFQDGEILFDQIPIIRDEKILI